MRMYIATPCSTALKTKRSTQCYKNGLQRLKMEKDIDKLIQFISEHFVFNEDVYPELKDVGEKERLNFAIRHLSLHFSKTAGKVTAVSEAVDHGRHVNVEELKANVPKALITTLRLAELVDVSGEDLIKAIEKKYGDRIDFKE